MPLASMTSGDFNQNPSKAKKAANDGPLVITEHGEARYVLVRYSDFKDHWRASRSLYDALNHADSPFDDAFEPERASFADRDVTL
ncbi:type II toxin-antitoxin system Phd/YefM family antitoxin [Shinella zoogloeoides]|uniref:Type II toxin-antitoxin system Phd/YefM family antitoxin n=1 Tax=Shinella zoogloeoides TaxID=352475 RepID=A0A6N8TK01_SHIZO|nr:type II toxin-antitoxin system Phd/YefM family antitoxin [Shinella zoogloeoides]MXO01440.1 type II toxin-antitoxin system Phd/YefM family antitoxin [Shinella zoogloeoides]UEX81466.1 type II toxin-antitoxin system Phd/YefM family antitoxin [Shinella zoogloeoides]